MKLKQILLIIFCACSAIIMAQPRLLEEEMYVGVHGGVIASMVSFTPTIEQSALNPHLGANGGFIFRYAGHKVCGLQVELNYMRRGWHEVETNYTRNIDYIEVPFLMHLSVGKKFRGFLNLGPQIGYAIHESETNRPVRFVTGQHIAQYNPIDTPFDWGLAGGLGMLYRTKNAGVYQLEARFNFNFGDIFSNHKADYFSKSSIMSLSLNLAWLWQFKGEK